MKYEMQLMLTKVMDSPAFFDSPGQDLHTRGSRHHSRTVESNIDTRQEIQDIHTLVTTRSLVPAVRGKASCIVLIIHSNAFCIMA